MIGDRQKTIFLFEEKETECPPQGNVSYSLSAVYDDQACRSMEASSMQEESRAGKRISEMRKSWFGRNMKIAGGR